jgi:hypothetical protein
MLLHHRGGIVKPFIIIVVAVLGACSVVDERDGAKGSPAATIDPAPSAGGSLTPEPPAPIPFTCNGTSGQWPGCRGNGCAVCAELVGNAPCYFHNHPSCSPNTTCMGGYFTCNAACPQPTAADFSSNCGPVCGDHVCSGGETCSTCPDDCGSCPPRCGHCADGSECCGIDECSDNSICM